ncbi:MAG: transglutaminase domain-containing protein [Roseiflexaceae bacterium]
MTHAIPEMTAHTIGAIGTCIDAMLQQRVPTFTITYLEKKRISDPAALISQCIHGATDPHFHAVSQYQIGTTVYAHKTVLAIEFDYLENNIQLSYVNLKAQQIVRSITDAAMHQQQKLLAIHDWITTHIRYDETLRRRTAFDALDTQSTVCSGYASLYWHMCHAVGIPCRIVTGTGKFEAHAWNMVQLDRYWYHVDSTWSTVADTNAPFSRYRFTC